MGITRPTEGDISEDVEEGVTLELWEAKRVKGLVKVFTPYASFIGKAPTDLAMTILSISERDRDSYFQREIAPHMARASSTGCRWVSRAEADSSG